jgi:hypothetical protein
VAHHKHDLLCSALANIDVPPAGPTSNHQWANNVLAHTVEVVKRRRWVVERTLGWDHQAPPLRA